MKQSGSKKNFGYTMIYQFLLMVMPLATAPYIARVLGAEGLGTYSYTYAVAHYFGIVALFGADDYGNNSIARIRDDREKRNQLFAEIYTMQLIISLGVTTVYLLYVLFGAEQKTYALLQTLYVLTAVFDIGWLYYGMEDFRVMVSKQISIKTFTFISIFLFVKNENDLWKYIVLMNGGQLVAHMSLMLFVRRHVRFALSGVRRALTHFKGFALLFLPTIAVSIYRVMDKMMLGTMNTMLQVGYYESAEKLVNVCLCAVDAIGTVMMPRMSNLLGRGKKEECQDLFVRSMEIALFMGFAIAFGIASVTDVFIPVFYGPGYEQSISVTMLLCAAVPFVSWACVVRMLYVIPARQNRTYIASMVLGAFVNLLVNALLIPQYGAAGAAVGTICAETLVAVSQTMMVKKELDIARCLRQSLPFLVFGMLMWGAVKIIPASLGSVGVTLAVKVCVGAALYLTCSGLYFIATKNQLVMGFIRQIRNKIRHK